MGKFTGMVLAAITVGAMCMAAGCSLLQEHKEDIHSAIIDYAETKGQEAAIAYVDQLVKDGKLGNANAEKIKAAIPKGIEKLKETMKVAEVSK